MRLRLFRTGTASKAIAFRFDKFPVVLRVEENGTVCTTQHGSCACELFNVGGQIEIQAHDENHAVLVNGAPVESGPLMPGDRLSVGSQHFLISYERTAIGSPPELKCRIYG